MQEYRNLRVWRFSQELAVAAYRVTRAFPRQEMFALTSQIRRAATSIPANLAEGCGRGGTVELRRFATVALGSACELEYHLFLASELRVLSPSDSRDLDARVLEVKKMLSGLVARLRRPSE